MSGETHLIGNPALNATRFSLVMGLFNAAQRGPSLTDVSKHLVPEAGLAVRYLRELGAGEHFCHLRSLTGPFATLVREAGIGEGPTVPDPVAHLMTLREGGEDPDLVGTALFRGMTMAAIEAERKEGDPGPDLFALSEDGPPV